VDWYSGSLCHDDVYYPGRPVSERIDHLKTAEEADIKMGALVLCEVDALTCESTDAQGMNVTSCRKIVTSTRYAKFLEYLLHYLPPVG
jgi:hypothetical protein